MKQASLVSMEHDLQPPYHQHYYHPSAKLLCIVCCMCRHKLKKVQNLGNCSSCLMFQLCFGQIQPKIGMQSRNWTPPLVLKNFGFLIKNITISILCSRLYFFRSSSIQHPAAKEQSILHGLQCRKGYMLIFQTCVDCFFFLMQCYMNHNLDFKFNAVQNSMKQKPSNGTFWYVRRAVTQAERNESVSLSQNYKTMCGLLMLPC